jgi:Protein of unknown function (DUF2568)
LTAVRSANLFAKFVLELAAVASFAYWGSTVGSGAISVAVAVAAPLAACVLWGRYAAPRASRRLPVPVRVPFELGVFALAALALVAAAATTAALAFAAAALINAALLTALRQWEG